ncbi:twin-arginine translocase subunit TatC, partial [Jatrophihabitans endophyticus]|uniref:twin-arginine translocase subunit TatC n=1 Tax=Jatrophihabitans endophyticus TaxID=1206085 RepID=UPI001A0F434F
MVSLTGRAGSSRRKHPRPPRDPEGRMPVMDHLRELRRRIVIILILVAIGAVVGYYLYPHTLSFLRHPYCSVPAKYRYASSQPGKAGGSKCSLFYFGVLDGFTTRLKVAVISGAVFTAPFWLYQVWAFVTPGL